MSGPSGLRGGWPTKIGDLISPALERLGPSKVMSEAKLRKVWVACVGEQVAANATVKRLRGTVLEVAVSSDSWATELTYLAGELIKKLNARLGDQTVTQIVVQRRKNSRST